MKNQQTQSGHAPRVLDPCCGSRMMWFNRSNTDTVFGDRRRENHTLCDGRELRIEPGIKLDVRALPFPDETFALVVFDPPHLHTAGPRSWMAAKYGKLEQEWRNDISAGFNECFRVLRPDGVLIFKWNETQVKIREVLSLTPIQPLFGHPTGRLGLTHWVTFMKPLNNVQG